MLIILFLCLPYVYSTVPVFGVLDGQLNYVQSDYNAGIRAAHIDIWWSGYEPAEGNFSTSYMSAIQQRINAFRGVGFDVSIGVNFHNYPTWILKQLGANYTSQFGTTTAGANIVFSQNIRNKAAAYVKQIAKAIGTNFNVRVGFAPDAGELLYPQAKPSNSLWCFDAAAQGKNSDLAVGTTPCPYPGWMPGNTTYKGAPFTVAMVEKYYDWYIEALVQGGDWMQKTYVQAGFTGKVEWLMPGSGMRPFDYTRYVNNYLIGNNGYDEVVGMRAAVWDRVIAGIANKTNVRIQITSMSDSSGSPRANNCTPGDASILPNNTGAIQVWSDTRWISYNANKFNLPKSAENPGPHDSATVAWQAAALMYSCGVERWYFCADSSLYDNYTGAAQLKDLAQIIKTYLPIWSTTTHTSTDVGTTTGATTGSGSSTSGYQGCYVDSATRDLPFEFIDSSQTTIERCQYSCGLRQYKYAALQYGSQCFCGNSYGSQGKATDSDCSKTCAANSMEKCGGSYRNSVYTAGNVGYLGCYVDSSSRDLSFLATTSSSMTIDTCRQTCASSGYKYAGLQVGSQCFCDNDYGGQGQALDTDCSSVCAGDNTEKCGAGWRNSVYTAMSASAYPGYSRNVGDSYVPTGKGGSVSAGKRVSVPITMVVSLLPVSIIAFLTSFY